MTLNAHTYTARSRRHTDRDSESDTSTSQEIRNGNDLVVKLSWPRKSWEGEMKFTEKAKEIRESSKLVKDHIPAVFGHLDSPYFSCSTRPIRELHGLEVDGERVPRVIASHRKVESEIEFLDRENMLIVLLDYFFCEFPSQFLRHLMTLILRQVTGLCGTMASSTEILALET